MKLTAWMVCAGLAGGSVVSGYAGGSDPGSLPSGTVFDHLTTDVTRIPEEAIRRAARKLHVAYWHTSHGSHVVSGLAAMRDHEPFGGRFALGADGSSGLHFDNTVGNYGKPCPDLSHCSDGGEMLADTRRILQAQPEINVVMWAWCSISGHDVDTYLKNMETLIAEFGPGGSDPRTTTTPVEFIFMTAHSEGSRTFPREAAAKIRSHCEAKGRWLIDYYDIESHDIDGKSYAELSIADNLAYDSGNWAVEYLAREDADATLASLTGAIETCAHSDDPVEARLNCALKGQATWWALARIAGWRP